MQLRFERKADELVYCHVSA